VAVAAPGSGDDDPQREARAYNENIYLMVAAPYALLAGFGFVIYRGCKKIHAAEQAKLDAIEGQALASREPLSADTRSPPPTSFPDSP
jgi:hypothetical protein